MSRDTILSYAAIAVGMVVAYVIAYIARQKFQSIWAKAAFLIIATVAGIAAVLFAAFVIGTVASLSGLSHEEIRSIGVALGHSAFYGPVIAMAAAGLFIGKPKPQK